MKTALLLSLAVAAASAATFSNIAAAKDFTVRNAKGTEFHDVQIDSEAFRAAKPHADAAVVDPSGAKDVFVRECRTAPGTGTFLNIPGEHSANVVLTGNNLRNAKQAVAAGKGAAKSIVSEK